MSSQSKIIKDILSLYDTILENKEVEETADSLRDTVKNLGYAEKGSELTSGGNVNNEITELVAQILTQYKKTNPNVNVRITAGNDNYHQKLNYTSQHKLGNAIDVVLDPYNSSNASSFIKILNDFKSKNSKFSYIDEYNNPSGAATAGHFHLQYGGSASSTSTSGNPYSNTSSDTTSSDTTSSDTTSSDSSTNNRKFAADIAKPILNAIGLKEEKVYSSFGKNFDIRYGEVIIPKDSNEKIKSPVSGVITSYSYNSDCDNQLVIKFEVDGNDFYLEYCGLKSTSVRQKTIVSKGDLIGLSDSDVKVTLYDSNGDRKRINTNLESSGKSKSNDEKSKSNDEKSKKDYEQKSKEELKKMKDDAYIASKNEYSKLLIKAHRKLKNAFKRDEKPKTDETPKSDEEPKNDEELRKIKKVQENINRIKSLL